MYLGLPRQYKGLLNVAVILNWARRRYVHVQEKPHVTNCQVKTSKSKQRGEGDGGSVGEVLYAETELNSHTQHPVKKLGVTMPAFCSNAQRQTQMHTRDDQLS